MSNNLLITGGSGFIGSHLVKYLSSLGLLFITTTSSSHARTSSDQIKLDLAEDFDLKETLKKISCVIHLAGVAHQKKEIVQSVDYKKINADAAIKLAQQAAEAGVKRFIFLSSIGVNGRFSVKPFTINDTPNPYDAYTESKLFAEEGIKNVCRKYGMQYVIIRPPLVYGIDAPGNFRTLKHVISSFPVLPFGSIDNKRSFVFIHNLIDLIFTCVESPLAGNKTFLVSDDKDISTAGLLKLMSSSQGKRLILLPIPKRMLFLLGSIFRNKEMLEKLCCDLQVDITYTKETLGWRPPISVEEGIRLCFKSVEC